MNCRVNPRSDAFSLFVSHCDSLYAEDTFTRPPCTQLFTSAALARDAALYHFQHGPPPENHALGLR